MLVTGANVHTGSLKIKFQGGENTMIVNGASAIALELLFNSHTSGVKGSLLEVLDHTKTKAGARLLRTELLQPSASLPTIQARLDAVEEISSNQDLYTQIGQVRQGCSHPPASSARC